MTHSFAVTIDGQPDFASMSDAEVADLADALYEAGCDDASFSISGSVLRMRFDREAPSPREAVASALGDMADAFLGMSDAEAAREAIEDARTHGTVPWERIKVDLGLSPESSELLRRGIEQARAGELVSGPDLDADDEARP